MFIEICEFDMPIAGLEVVAFSVSFWGLNAHDKKSIRAR